MPKHRDFAVRDHNHSNVPVKVTKLRIRENKASDSDYRQSYVKLLRTNERGFPRKWQLNSKPLVQHSIKHFT